MSAGFTPGPWAEMPTDASLDDNYHPEDGGQRINTWVGVGNPNVRDGMVAIAVDYAGEETPKLDANISLIAAAPELYGLLSKIDAMWSEHLEPGEGPEAARSGAVREVWQQLRDALAKARGEQVSA